MKSATRVLAAIATAGVLAGGAVALLQMPSPKTATTAAVSTSTGDPADQALQQLTDESARLHAAVESAQGQLANVRANTPESSPPTAKAGDLPTLLAQAESQLATARQRLAIDEALLAKMQSKAGATTPTPVQHSAPEPVTPTPTTPRAPVQQPAATAPPTTTPVPHHTHSPSPRPTNGTGDD